MIQRGSQNCVAESEYTRVLHYMDTRHIVRLVNCLVHLTDAGQAGCSNTAATVLNQQDTIATLTSLLNQFTQTQYCRVHPSNKIYGIISRWIRSNRCLSSCLGRGCGTVFILYCSLHRWVLQRWVGKTSGSRLNAYCVGVRHCSVCWLKWRGETENWLSHVVQMTTVASIGPLFGISAFTAPPQTHATLDLFLIVSSSQKLTRRGEQELRRPTLTSVMRPRNGPHTSEESC